MSKAQSKAALDPKICATYAVFITAAIVVYQMVAGAEFSSVLTLSAIFQCLAFSLLGVQVYTSGVKGVSARSLKLDALALACRLSSTTWLNGYLPEDSTGDHVYQAIDFLSLALVIGVLYQILYVNRSSYDISDDSLSPLPFVFASFILAAAFHGDLNDRPIFDTLWMAGLFISAVSVMPQLWMMTHGSTSVSALTSHFVAVMAFSRVLSGTYMWHAYPEITCEPWVGTFQHAGLAIMAAHAVHLLLLGDFTFYYVKTLAKSGLAADLELPGNWMV